VKVGDLVRHYDGDKGIVIGYAPSSNYPYRVWFFTSSRSPDFHHMLPQADWFVKSVFRVISESR